MGDHKANFGAQTRNLHPVEILAGQSLLRFKNSALVLIVFYQPFYPGFYSSRYSVIGGHGLNRFAQGRHNQPKESVQP
ncbi:MAG: hypothetical protein HZB23_10610 [Deltaproteobacteria bacterium]|nr:hypothetical protein [Deltaproteobacteria bacterium]